MGNVFGQEHGVNDFIKMGWKLEAAKSVMMLLSSEHTAKPFIDFVAKTGLIGRDGLQELSSTIIEWRAACSDDMTQLRTDHMRASARSLLDMWPASRGTKEEEQLRAALSADIDRPSFDSMLEKLTGMLGEHFLPQFMMSDECDKMIEDIQYSSDIMDVSLLSRIKEARDTAPMIDQGNALRKRSWLVHFMASSEFLPLCICLSDSRRPDFPLIYVNREFERVTEYSREECIGRNCRFLSGAETSNTDKQEITDGLKKGKSVFITVTNHKKSGTVFRNYLALKPLFLETNMNEPRFYLGVQFDLDEFKQKSRRDALSMLSQHGAFAKWLPSSVTESDEIHFGDASEVGIVTKADESDLSSLLTSCLCGGREGSGRDSKRGTDATTLVAVPPPTSDRRLRARLVKCKRHTRRATKN